MFPRRDRGSGPPRAATSSTAARAASEIGHGGAKPGLELRSQRPDLGLQELDPGLGALDLLTLDQEVPARRTQLLPDERDLTAPPLRGSDGLVLQVRSASGGLARELDGFLVVLEGLQLASGGGELELQPGRLRDRSVELPVSGVSIGPQLESLGLQRTELFGLFGELCLQRLGL